MGKLVLARRVHESIVICDGAIVVTVEAVKGNRVSLSFTADRDLPIARLELHEKLQRKKEAVA